MHRSAIDADNEGAPRRMSQINCSSGRLIEQVFTQFFRHRNLGATILPTITIRTGIEGPRQNSSTTDLRSDLRRAPGKMDGVKRRGKWIEAWQRVARGQGKTKLFRDRNAEGFRELQITIHGVGRDDRPLANPSIK